MPSVLGQRNILLPRRYRMARRSSFFRYRMERRSSFFYGRFDYHQSRQHISERHEPRSLLKYTALIVIFHAFFLSGFRIFVFRISRRSMLSECQGANLPFIFQRMCRSRRIVCSCPFMVRASTFLLNLVWTFCHVLKKARFLSFLFSCGIFLQPKRV